LKKRINIVALYPKFYFELFGVTFTYILKFIAAAVASIEIVKYINFTL